MDSVGKIMSLISLSEKLKSVLRHSWTSSGRHESVAEHTWRMSLIGVLVAGSLDSKVDELKLLKLIIVHDLVEAIVGDMPAFDLMSNAQLREAKKRSEQAAIEEIAGMLPNQLGKDIQSLWEEFEEGQSYEAKVAIAIDKLEAQIQHNEADMSTWLDVERGMTFRLGRYTTFDSFLDSVRRQVEQDGADKLAAAGFDVAGYREAYNPA